MMMGAQDSLPQKVKERGERGKEKRKERICLKKEM
uniref:Uncharacterized protein n=1 Tax=Anguilla anguilla TaxID=7936 RepID=A0A0E9SGD1_ANGAN